MEEMFAWFLWRLRRIPKIDNATWSPQSMTEDQLSVVSIKGQDNALLLFGALQDLGICCTGDFLNNRNNIKPSAAQTPDACDGEVFISEQHQSAAIGSAMNNSSFKLSAAKANTARSASAVNVG